MFWSCLAQFFLGWEIFQTKSVENIKTQISYSITFSNNSAVCEIKCKNTVEPDRSQMTIWRMRIACWVPKATTTHKICNTYCHSTATMVVRTRLNSMLYVHLLPRLCSAADLIEDNPRLYEISISLPTRSIVMNVKGIYKYWVKVSGCESKPYSGACLCECKSVCCSTECYCLFKVVFMFRGIVILLLVVYVIITTTLLNIIEIRGHSVVSSVSLTDIVFFCPVALRLNAGMASSLLRFLDHIQWLTTLGRTPLDEWPARRRDLYLTTQHSQQTNIRAADWIRPHNLSRQDLRFRPRDHWNQHQTD